MTRLWSMAARRRWKADSAGTAESLPVGRSARTGDSSGDGAMAGCVGWACRGRMLSGPVCRAVCDSEDVADIGQVGEEDAGHGWVVAAHVAGEVCFGGDDAFGERLLLVPPAGRFVVCLDGEPGLLGELAVVGLGGLQ